MALLSSCLLDSSTEWKAENLLYQTLGLLPFTSFLWRPCEGQPPVPAMPKQCCLYLEIAYDFGLKYHEKRWKKHEISVSELRVFTSKACWYLVHSCAAWQVRNCTWSSQRGVHRRQQTRERSLPNWQFLRLQHCPELFIHQNSVSLRLHCQITDALALTTVFWTCAFTRQLKLLNLQALEMQGKTHVVCGRVQISILMTTIQHAIVGQECESQQACLSLVKPVICIVVTFKLDQSSWSCPIFKKVQRASGSGTVCICGFSAKLVRVYEGCLSGHKMSGLSISTCVLIFWHTILLCQFGWGINHLVVGLSRLWCIELVHVNLGASKWLKNIEELIFAEIHSNSQHLSTPELIRTLQPQTSWRGRCHFRGTAPHAGHSPTKYSKSLNHGQATQLPSASEHRNSLNKTAGM